MDSETFSLLSNEFALFKQSPIPTLCISEHGSILLANDAAINLLQLKEEILMDKPIVTLVEQCDRRKFNTFLFESRQQHKKKCEINLKLRFGDIIPAQFHSESLITTEDIEFSILSIIDISEQKSIEYSLTQTQDELKYLAHHDSLTNLPNRYLLQDRLESAIARTKRNGWLGALVFADVDRFKVINDDYGHHIGDLVLKEVSRRFKKTVRQQDTVCRYSGDEFVLILEDITCEADAKNVIEKIINAFAEPIQGLIEHPLKVSTSIGISLFDKQDEDTEIIIKNADYAMYESKKRGRNCYTFYSSEHSMAQNLNFIMENELSIAIENNEFKLNFQPQVNTSNNQIEGIEVLTRWLHPRRGLVHPSEFIHRMENANLTSHLTEWLLNEACMVANEWLDNRLDFKRIAVNITPKEFMSPNFINHVKKALSNSGLPPHKLELELTESTIIQNPAVAGRLLRQFQQMGIRLSLDDFGTGYSALSYLNDYPFNCIKIDKSFVDNLPENKKSSTLVDAIISIAKSLELDIIAEGVEQNEQKEYLSERGCDLMQGFLFSRPIEHAKMTSMLNNVNTTIIN